MVRIGIPKVILVLRLMVQDAFYMDVEKMF